MKNLILSSLLMAFASLSLAQGIYNNGARIVSESGSYWVVDNGAFTLTSASSTNLAQFHNLNIASDASITMPTSTCMTVSGTLTNAGALTINDGASMITNGSISNSGSVQIKQSLSSSAENGEWHYISSPTSSSTANTFYGQYLQEWSEANHLWTDIVDPETVLTPGKGYALWVPTTKASFTYSGTPNTGQSNIAMTFTEYSDDPEDYEGANLVGNPYPCYVDFDMVGGYGAKYTWNGTAYVSYNEGGDGSQYIAPMEGFIIVTGYNRTFTIESGDRTHVSGSKSEETKKLEHGLVLYASNGSYQDELWLKLEDQSQQNFELDHDAWKFKTNTSGISQLWSVCPNGNLSIDVRPEEETIQLGFSNDVNGTYSIGSQQINGIALAELEDTKLNIFHDLTKGAYDFNWQTTDSEERFILHLKATGTEEMEAQATQVYAANGQLYIRMMESSSFDQLAIYDLAGRLVFESELQNEELQSIDLNYLSGAYLIQLKGSNNSLTKKIIMK